MKHDTTHINNNYSFGSSRGPSFDPSSDLCVVSYPWLLPFILGAIIMSYIYILKVEGIQSCYKIGQTSNLRKRVQDLNRFSTIKVSEPIFYCATKIPTVCERAVRCIFTDKKASKRQETNYQFNIGSTEWYYLSQRDLEFLKEFLPLIDKADKILYEHQLSTFCNNRGYQIDFSHSRKPLMT